MMVMRKKIVSKKQAAESRGIKCRLCYRNMKQQNNLLSDTPDWLCEHCGAYHRKQADGSWVWVVP